MQKASIPVKLYIKYSFIDTGVVNEDIPLLLLQKIMKNKETKINFKNDTATMLCRKQDLTITTAGYYAIPLEDKQVLEKICTKNDIKITLNSSMLKKSDKVKVA